MKELVERVRELQVDQGLTNNDFAEKLEISPAALSHIYGGRNNPSLTILDAIAQKFPNVNFNYILKGEGKLYTSTDEMSFTKHKVFNELNGTKEPANEDTDLSQSIENDTAKTDKLTNTRQDKKITFVNSGIQSSEVIKVAFFMSDGRVFFFTPQEGNPFQ